MNGGDGVAAEALSYLDKLKLLVLDFLLGDDVSVYLFGSWARGEQKRSSDVDLAIEYQSGYAPAHIEALREAVEESGIPYNVDIVDMRNASPHILSEIRKDGVQWK